MSAQRESKLTKAAPTTQDEQEYMISSWSETHLSTSSDDVSKPEDCVCVYCPEVPSAQGKRKVAKEPRKMVGCQTEETTLKKRDKK